MPQLKKLFTVIITKVISKVLSVKAFLYGATSSAVGVASVVLGEIPAIALSPCSINNHR